MSDDDDPTPEPTADDAGREDDERPGMGDSEDEEQAVRESTDQLGSHGTQ